MLVASHIVPWSVDEKNRLNPENGLCLNALHDKAFDQGLITITTEYKVKLSSELYNQPNDDTMQRFFKEYENKQIVLPERSLPNKDFLDFHFNTIFIK
jgi:putative restriction endonuclease